ncbi:MAG: UDP-glucose 4-epimerase GalE [Pseudomonadota bacterium]
MTGRASILVVGGAGYIGSHMVRQLDWAGHRVTTLDDLSTGHRDAVLAGDFVQGSCGDSAVLDELLGQRRFDAVMHFASFIQVGESVTAPGKYYQNNLCASLTLLDGLVRHGIRQFLFSSTAAIFGIPERIPIDEAHPQRPINPYGRTKWMLEQALVDYQQAHGLESVCLRYFNAAGAAPDAALGERHDPETHLIPLILQVAARRRPAIQVYGNDYPTPDGTCIRDYIHIEDLCTAHLLALDWLLAGGGSARYNLGNGQGFSVQAVIDAVRRLTGHPIPQTWVARRPGDPAILVADAAAIQQALGWQPRYPDLDTLIAHAWAFEQRRS